MRPHRLKKTKEISKKNGASSGGSLIKPLNTNRWPRQWKGARQNHGGGGSGGGVRP